MFNLATSEDPDEKIILYGFVVLLPKFRVNSYGQVETVSSPIATLFPGQA